MFPRLPRLLMTVALACSIGLHWSFLQTVAWTTMLVDNLSSTSFSEAVQRTFDGKHPCSLCKVVAAGKNSENKSKNLLPLKKFEGMNQVVAIVIFAPAAIPPESTTPELAPPFERTPPTPPPRAA